MGYNASRCSFERSPNAFVGTWDTHGRESFGLGTHKARSSSPLYWWRIGSKMISLAYGVLFQGKATEERSRVPYMTRINPVARLATFV